MSKRNEKAWLANEPFPLRVKKVEVGPYTYPAPWALFDGNGWCRGGARTATGAKKLAQEIESGATISPILSPVWRTGKTPQ